MRRAGAGAQLTCLAAIVAMAPLTAHAQDRLSSFRDRPIAPRRYQRPTVDACFARERGPDGVARPRFCDGPRRVAEAEGEASARAARLGLGTRPAADRLRIGRPPPEWRAEIASSSPVDDLLWPVPWGLFSRGFGFVRRAEIRHRPHNGVDIVARAGAHIRAVNDALVVYADTGVRGYGNFLILLHADGTATFYGHCRALYVAAGELVARGQTVGEVGNTGRPFVPHLHFEWRRNGEAMDPMRRFVERPSHETVRPDGGQEDAPPPPNAASTTPVASRRLSGGDGSQEEEGEERGAGAPEG